MTNKKGQDPNLYCDFHKDSGHLTDDCYSLRQEIERALKSGKLSHLVKNVRKDTRQLQRHDEGSHKKVRRLETHMVNGPRYTAREKGKRPYEPSWQEQQVIFPVVRGGPRATRPVVITGIIGHYETEYIFIDPGSTADIIYEQCFNQLDEEDKARLEPVDYPLSGFCNEMVFPLGADIMDDPHHPILARGGASREQSGSKKNPKQSPTVRNEQRYLIPEILPGTTTALCGPPGRELFDKGNP
ncbi:uncharacterized protein LOC118491578 [Helianthus annuus]|uniref:uncharacterized protein LOC118491578 n=1 Tax=Helianthus annuus TaxID=4232 RepID=UPI0016533470|nr:uncharacterized protein LOC118491578 [Helianthus annuus]